MKHLEAVAYLVFVVYLLSFLAASQMAARDAGRSVWLFDNGPRRQRLTALMFRLGFAGGAIWPMCIALGFDPVVRDPLRMHLDNLVADLLGHLLVTIGACVAMVSQLHMGASWRIGAIKGELGQIIDTGPFAVSRNPVFVGQALLFLGLFLVFPGIIQAFLTVVVLLAIRLQVAIEEPALLANFGEPYRIYKSQVRRWIGTRTDQTLTHRSMN
ncbi:MAG: isoprenylcysteine carboxylmethyltransferase family protein [Hyphomicrobium sp.]|nr:isoprenylcysteine carboxylmethyltransferase family protein [Hyphomicrobium sp.]